MPGGATAFQPIDIAVTSIEYGKNAGAGLSHHSRVVLEYASSLEKCAGSQVPIGAQLDFRTGFPLYRRRAASPRTTGAARWMSA